MNGSNAEQRTGNVLNASILRKSRYMMGTLSTFAKMERIASLLRFPLLTSLLSASFAYFPQRLVCIKEKEL